MNNKNLWRIQLATCINKDRFTKNCYLGASAASRPTIQNRRSNNMTPKTMKVRVFKLQANLSTQNVTYSLQSRHWQTGDHQNNTSTNTRGCLTATPGDIRGNVKISWKISTTLLVKLSKVTKRQIKIKEKIETHIRCQKREAYIKNPDTRSDTKPFLRNETTSKPVPCLNNSQISQIES